MSWELWMDPPGNYTTYNLDGTSSSYAVKLGTSGGTLTTIATGTLVYDFRSDKYTSQMVASGTRNVSHIASGARVIAYQATGTDTHSGAPLGSVTTTSKTMTLTVPSAPTPAPTQNSAPTISGTGEAGTDITFSGGTYTNATSVTTKLVAAINSSMLTGGGGTEKDTSSPYTITDNDAASPAYYFATMDTVNGTGGPYYFYSGTILSYPAIPSYTVSFTNTYGSNGAIASKTVKKDATTTFPDPGTRAGYTFNGWNNNTNYYVGATTPSVTADITYSADSAWKVLAPGFTDETVTSQLYINQTIESTTNNSVSATNTTSYTLEYAGTGLNATSWLTINASTGELSGSTNVPGTYTFRVKATGATSSAYSNTITITVVYPGKRTNSSLAQAQFSTAKRWDGSQWVALTQMKRWNGSAWVNVSN